MDVCGDCSEGTDCVVEAGDLGGRGGVVGPGEEAAAFGHAVGDGEFGSRGEGEGGFEEERAGYHVAAEDDVFNFREVEGLGLVLDLRDEGVEEGGDEEEECDVLRADCIEDALCSGCWVGCDGAGSFFPGGEMDVRGYDAKVCGSCESAGVDVEVFAPGLGV